MEKHFFLFSGCSFIHKGHSKFYLYSKLRELWHNHLSYIIYEEYFWFICLKVYFFEQKRISKYTIEARIFVTPNSRSIYSQGSFDFIKSTIKTEKILKNSSNWIPWELFQSILSTKQYTNKFSSSYRQFA